MRQAADDHGRETVAIRILHEIIVCVMLIRCMRRIRKLLVTIGKKRPKSRHTGCEDRGPSRDSPERAIARVELTREMHR